MAPSREIIHWKVDIMFTHHYPWSCEQIWMPQSLRWARHIAFSSRQDAKATKFLPWNSFSLGINIIESSLSTSLLNFAAWRLCEKTLISLNRFRLSASSSYFYAWRPCALARDIIGKSSQIVPSHVTKWLERELNK